MYGWDSYFIIRGLLRDGRLELARGMVDNFFFEIEHYGAVLNANRTYYLTRSQPPFLSSMVMAVHRGTKSRRQRRPSLAGNGLRLREARPRRCGRERHTSPGTLGSLAITILATALPLKALQDENDIYRQVATYFLLSSLVLPRNLRKSRMLPTAEHPDAGYSVRVCRKDPRVIVRALALDQVEGRLLQGRPIDARVGIRYLLSLWSLWRGHSSLSPRCA